MAFPLFLPSYTKKLCKLTTYLVFFHYNCVYTNKLYYDCLCATELGISFIQGKNVMTIKEKMRELEEKNSWDKWSKKDKALYIKLTIRNSQIHALSEYKAKDFEEVA